MVSACRCGIKLIGGLGSRRRSTWKWLERTLLAHVEGLKGKALGITRKYGQGAIARKMLQHRFALQFYILDGRTVFVFVCVLHGQVANDYLLELLKLEMDKMIENIKDIVENYNSMIR